MFNLDTMTIEILEDGTIRTTTDAVSGANHANAEQFLRWVAQQAAGETSRVKRNDAAAHSHAHSHAHGEHEHSH
jgi:hypothetical protein